MLTELQERLDALSRRAAEKLAEIHDDTPENAARAIQSDHRRIVGEIEEIRRQIAAAEAEQKRANPPSPVPPGGIEAERQAAATAERARIAAIHDDAAHFRMPAEFVRQHIAAGTSVSEFRLAILERQRAVSERNPTFSGFTPGGLDETETRRRGMSAAIVARMRRAAGERNVDIPEFARAYGEMELAEMAAECIGHRGALRTSRQLTEMFERAFHTTSDFPGIFTNALNTRLLARYQAAAPTYRRWAARYSTPDFRATNVIRAGDFPALQEVNEAGEIKSGTFGESAEQVQTRAYGVKLSFTRTMIVNDQLGAIDQVLGSAGERVGDWENSIAYAALLSGAGAGPVLVTDGKRVFHADHGNLGSATAIDVTNVGKGRAAMMKQTTLDGIRANFVPVTLLAGPDKLTEAEQLLTTLTPPEQAKAIPESIRRLTPVGDANIPGNAWYLFADPAVAPCFVYSYLEGFEGPRLSAEDVFDVQGMRVKLEHDFGVAAIDYRGGYRNPGA